jgi:hypothetical protein
MPRRLRTGLRVARLSGWRRCSGTETIGDRIAIVIAACDRLRLGAATASRRANSPTALAPAVCHAGLWIARLSRSWFRARAKAVIGRISVTVFTNHALRLGAAATRGRASAKSTGRPIVRQARLRIASLCRRRFRSGAKIIGDGIAVGVLANDRLSLGPSAANGRAETEPRCLPSISHACLRVTSLRCVRSRL